TATEQLALVVGLAALQVLLGRRLPRAERRVVTHRLAQRREERVVVQAVAVRVEAVLERVVDDRRGRGLAPLAALLVPLLAGRAGVDADRGRARRGQGR